MDKSSSSSLKKKPLTFFPERVSQSNLSMVDLHGASEEKAKERVGWHLQMAEQMNVQSFRFVTGRGNHVNSRGERGTLYREFPNWISENDSSKIEEVKKCDGYYEVKLKAAAQKKLFPTFVEHMSRQWIKDNIQTIQSRADEGDDFSQYLLGDCHYHGIGVTQDYKEAAKYYEKAHQQNNEHATYALGGCYWQGRSVRQSDATAIELFKAAAAKDFPRAHHQLGDIYCYGEGVEADLVQALDHYEKAAPYFDLAKRKAAHIYRWGGKGFTPDEKKAFSLYKELADRGDAFSAYNVAIAYFTGDRGTDKNIPQAFHYAKQSAKGNDPDAQYFLYMHYPLDPDLDKKTFDPEEGFSYLKQAADQEHKRALFMMAFHPRTKREDQNQYIIRAAKADDMIAQAFVLEILPKNLLTVAERKSIEENFWAQEDKELTENMYTGHYQAVVLDAYIGSENLTRRRREKVIRLLNTLVTQKNTDALLRLGSLYRTGEKGLVRQDVSMTEKLWLEGAALKCKGCACSLGYFYEQKDDKNKAFRFYKEGAELGSANSHNQVGQYYEYGWGGAQMSPEKAEWHYKQAMALEKGPKWFEQKSGLSYVSTYPCATYNLGRLYFKQKRREEGIVMLAASAQAGEASAKDVLQKMGVTEERIAALAMHAETREEKSSAPITPRALLNDIADALSLPHEWNITKDNKAWCYIPLERTEEIRKRAIAPFVIRNTQDKKRILMLEKISVEQLEKILANLIAEQPSNAPAVLS